MQITDAQTNTAIQVDSSTNIRLPAGKYTVSYSFEGTGNLADTISIVPIYNGVADLTAARRYNLNDAGTMASINGIFAFTATAASTLYFSLSYADGGTITGPRFAVIVQKMS